MSAAATAGQPPRLRPIAAIALAAVAGVAHAAAFAPWPSAVVQWLALAAMLVLVRGCDRPRTALALGLAFGLAHYLLGIGWLVVSMHRYGGMPLPLALAALALLSLYLSLFHLPAVWLWHRLRARPATALAGFAGAWTLGEWLRGTLFTGFPWLASGYAHVDSPLAGFAPLAGVYAVGLVAAAGAAAATLVVAPGARRGTARRLGLAVVVGAVALGALLRLPQWSNPTATALPVRLLQGNVSQDMKFDPRRTVAAMSAYVDAVEVAGEARLVVLPETAWTVPWRFTPAELAGRLAAQAREPGRTVVVGLPAETVDGRLANSVARVTPDGRIDWRYDKRHLVPFGEFVPPGFRWFVDRMHIPLGDFARGAARQPALAVDGQRLAFNVCYEDLFGEELLGALHGEDGATMLVNVSNIAWFGDSHAVRQHLEISRMRAIETARPMLRATNTGATAVIDARGRVLAELAPFTRGALEATVHGALGITPYARTGNAAVLLLAAGLLAIALPAAWRAGGTR